ncbi:hypothetical protein HMPREF9103_01298 [Lentilactobacillus parafarraginis F0439]|uniref:Uncharacterized protein n=1 Tax=Lentilactobacillus parafarraginis F0439 TaxID=797515 RepID=G9ZNJ5_9LACO|nr:hypothetical protein HMPREF9103_01298 [Lentilactobacillus parafarraginis F0439]
MLTASFQQKCKSRSAISEIAYKNDYTRLSKCSNRIIHNPFIIFYKKLTIPVFGRII